MKFSGSMWAEIVWNFCNGICFSLLRAKNMLKNFSKPCVENKEQQQQKTDHTLLLFRSKNSLT